MGDMRICSFCKHLNDPQGGVSMTCALSEDRVGGWMTCPKFEDRYAKTPEPQRKSNPRTRPSK